MTAKAEALTSTQGRRLDGPGEYRYTGHADGGYYISKLCEVSPGGWVDLLGVDRLFRVVDMPGEFVPLAKPVAAPEPNEDREPSWRDYETLTLHDLAWLREAAEEYEWAHRNDASVDIDRIRMVIRRIHKAGEARNE